MTTDIAREVLPDHENEPADLGDQMEVPEAEEAYYVASQWQLMWWKFRKHRLAMVATPVLGFLYLCAILADLIAFTLPLTRYTDYKYAPPTTIHFRDEAGRLVAPFVYGMTRRTDPNTLERTFVVDPSRKFRVRLLVHGEPHKLLGVFNTDIHLVGVDEGGPFFLLGTDDLGRDLLTRILYGSRISLSVGLVGVAITFVLGMLIGGVSGYFGGIVDNMIQRSIDLIISIPGIPLWMALAAAMPRDWPITRVYLAIVVITSVINWCGLARVVRGKFLSMREETFCEAARLAGASDARIILRHLIPSFASYIIIRLTLAIPGTILGETALSFLGLGLQPPAVSWGVLMRQAQNLQTIAFYPWLLAPAAWIVVTVLMFNFLGDGIRDAADPYK